MAGPDHEVRAWARQNVAALLGTQEATLVDYVISLAEKGRPQDVFAAMADDVPPARAAEARAFARELHRRLSAGSRPAPGRTEARKAATNRDLLRQSAQFELVASEDEGDYAAPPPRPLPDADQGERRKKKKKHSRKRKRRHGDGSESSEDETRVRSAVEERALAEEAAAAAAEAEAAAAAAPPEDEEDAEGEGGSIAAGGAEDGGGRSAALDDDIAERDAFVQRMLSRDDARTKKATRGGLTAAQEAAVLARRRAEGAAAEEGGEIDIGRLREASRQSYLKKREEKQLLLAEMELKEEELLFSGVRKSRAERQRLDLQRRVVQVARDRDRLDVEEGGYSIPDAAEESAEQRSAAAAAAKPQRYRDGGAEPTEQETWEQQQVGNAIVSGAARGAGDGEDFGFVFEDAVDFVSDGDAAKAATDVLLEPAAAEAPAGAGGGGAGTPFEAIQEVRRTLPVFAERSAFLRLITDNQVVVLVGETGSGKTTQIPQYLHEAGFSEVGRIGCTQPRRVAAMSVAARVAQEMGTALGRKVGYSIRFEDCTSDETIIKYMTDGMLLRELLTEPDLAGYSCMIVDEAHERTLHTDVLFGLLKDITRYRDDLRLVISSATLDADKFSAFFDGAPIFTVPGRMYPVQVLHTKAPEADYVDAAVVTVLQTHITQPAPGDILVFLTGQEEIEAAAEQLAQRMRGLGTRVRELIICPIYASMPSEQQARIFEPTPANARKVILATNIAETSLTISSVCYVVDSGFQKLKTYNPRSGMESLAVQPISKAAARQRKGRAGRTRAGVCFRLYTEWSFEHELAANTVPEIQRTNMGNVVLLLKSLGINDLLHFDFMDPPPSESLIRALEQLYALGALNERGELTKLGRRMAEFPLDPQQSKAVIAAERYGCVEEVVIIMAMLSVNNAIFHRPKEKAVHADTAKANFARGGGGDHLLLLRCFRQWRDADYSAQWCFENFVQHRSMNRARDVYEQLQGLCERVELEMTSSPEDADAIAKSIAAGFFYNTARLGKGGHYKTVKQNHTVYIHPGSCLAKAEPPPRWLVYHELAFTSKEYMRNVTPIQPDWLLEIAPHYYQSKELAAPQRRGRK